MRNNYFFLFFVVCMLLQACYYKPFVKYALNKEGFKKFSKKEKQAGNKQNPQRAYKVNRYDWELEVFPDKKRIASTMQITFTPTADQDTFLFDLQQRLKINSTTSKGNFEVQHKGDFLYLIFSEAQKQGERIQFTINYEGKPVNIAGEGPIQWKTDSLDRPWISSITEGIGPHFMMPCNILLGNESDTTSIQITAPKALTALANGKLMAVKTSGEKKTSRFLVTNPINIFNISFNLGYFEKLVKPYTDIHGVPRLIECYPLDYHKAVADDYYNQVPIIMNEFEALFGIFPWWNDGCRFIESTFSAMEHQSAIAMGDDYYKNWKEEYNTTLIHELAHEWWGNNITGKDYCDIWIHEGMATFSEALMLEQLYDSTQYDKKIFQDVRSVYNTIPIHKKCDVVYNSWTNGPDQDIYSKGSLMMHSLRKVVNNDTLFFSMLKQLQIDFAQQNVSTDEIIQKMNTLLGKDYSPLLNIYLFQAQAPQLDVFVDKNHHQIYYKWNQYVPFFEKENIYIKVGDKILTLTPTTDYQSFNTAGRQSLAFQIEKSVYYILNLKKEK